MASSELEVVSHLPVVRERSSVLLMPVMDVNTAMKRLEEFQAFCAHYLQESRDGGNDGGDYGVIPGTKKKTLLKSGADKLCEVYGLYDEYEIKATIDWEKGLFDYEMKCLLRSRRDDSLVGTGVGCCSSYESKYLWRDSQRVCPKCGSNAIIKGKEEYGGGWLCFVKKGGCGAKFKDGDKSIEGQTIGRIENEDIADIKNTVYKIAKKRAKIDAVIGATRSSGIFTQDLDEIPIPVTLKPEVQRTTEDIPLTTSAAPDNGQGGKPQEGTRPPVAAEIPPVAELVAEAKKALSSRPASLPAGCIEQGQAVNFAKLFKDSLKPHLRKQATELEHGWLKKQGIVDGDGNPTAKAILKDSFYEVRESAIQYAASLE